MSNSVFTDFTESNKNDNSLVIVMNKDGSVVSVDPTALRSYLKNESGSTSVSVVRVSSPTPSLKEEIELEEKEEKKSSKTVVDDDMDIESERCGDDIEEDPPHVRVTVEDFYPPDEARKFAAEILQYAGMTSHLLLDIDNEERLKSIHNDHCYTPLTSPSQRRSASRAQTPQSLSTATTATVKKSEPEGRKPSKAAAAAAASARDESVDEGEASEGDTATTETDSEFSASESESENDRDSDLDYTVNDRGGRRVRSKRARVVAVTKNISRNRAPKKPTFSLELEGETNQREEVKSPPKVVVEKKKVRPVKAPKPPAKKLTKKEEVQQTPKEEIKLPELPTVKTPQTPVPPPSQSVVKKKPPAHVEALFTDMTSLFSAPDIIKKVSTEVSSKAEPPPLVYTKAAYAQVKKEATLDPDRDQLELIESIVKQELETVRPTIDNSSQQMAEDIPSIVKMLENPETTIDPELLNDVIGLNATPTTTSNSVAGATAGDLDLLEGLTSDVGLPDDLMQHVAELVENKNLQEVIDKQVLGVQLPSSTVPPTTPTTSTPKATEERESPFVKLAKQKQLAKEAAASIMSMNRKEPIKIVRSDGRVITLPPIEAPTTRGAKRRAQSSTSTPNTSVTSSPVSTPQPPAKTPAETPRKAPPAKESKSSSRRTSATPSVAESEENMDSDASWNSEDDPDRLWCICKQPHNNRFMICCDSCEDWFHGKCVNITKAMGQQMEEQGIEWRCPNCLKKGSSSSSSKKSMSNDGESIQSPTTSSSGSSGATLSCIVCKKPARTNSIYCSDDCIRKHAMVTTKNTSKESSSASKTASAPPSSGTKKVGVLKNKFDRVIVYNRVTGKCLSGEQAPTLTNLKHWLSENPNYEVVQPGSALAQAFKAKQSQLATISKAMALKRQQQAEREAQEKEKVQTQLKVLPTKQVVVLHPSSGQKITADPKPKSSSKPTPQASTSSGSSSGQKNLKQQTLPVVRTKKSSTSSDSPKHSSKGEPEPIRVNARRTLKEQLSARIADTPEVQGKLTPDEIAGFATDVEHEMFLFFNKDTGTKYRAKYRSLMFNIKDRKNMSLLEKICEKIISPGQLVRMAPEELASQELAQWREKEAKHQLEMIKKSELDLLACAKNYVLKTHKGEEVIEDRISERVSLDPSIAVEDVVSVLNNSTVTSSSEAIDPNQVTLKTTLKGDKTKDGVSSSKSSSSSHSKKRDRDRRSRSRDRHESRSKSSKHKRKRSRDRRSRSRDKEDRHKDRKDRDKRDHDRSREKKSSSSSSTSVKKPSESKPSVPKETTKPVVLVEDKKEETYNLIDKILKASEFIEKPSSAGEDGKETKEKEQPVRESKVVVSESSSSSVIVEPPKKSMSVESDQEPSSTITIPTPPETTFDDNDEEEEEEAPEEYSPPSTIWSGSINMVDVATFQISGFSVSGDCEVVGKQLPSSLEIVGRIIPETVWEYIGKIKKSGNKEILIMQFKAETEDEQEKYFSLYQYLDSRKRLGVVKTSSTTIKDFYISPLAAHKSLPSVLLPIKGVGFEDNRPDLLLGIVVMIKGQGIKRVNTTVVSTKHSKRMALTKVAPAESHTPPTSPKSQISLKTKGSLDESRKKILMMMPKTSKEKVTIKATIPSPGPNLDDDEPYSPGGSDDDIPMLPSSSTSAPIAALDPEDIQRKMEELNRQIGAKKMEIAGILNKGQDPTNDEPYSPSRPVSPPSISAIPPTIPLANISIPSNLSEILASIKNVSGAPVATTQGAAVSLAKDVKSDKDDDDDDEEYTPVAPSSSTAPFASVDYKPAAGYKVAPPVEDSGPSKLAQLSEAELLSMVPDDALLDDLKGSTKEEERNEKTDDNYEPTKKKSKWTKEDESSEPPPPGLEDEYEPE